MNRLTVSTPAVPALPAAAILKTAWQDETNTYAKRNTELRDLVALVGSLIAPQRAKLTEAKREKMHRANPDAIVSGEYSTGTSSRTDRAPSCIPFGSPTLAELCDAAVIGTHTSAL